MKFLHGVSLRRSFAVGVAALFMGLLLYRPGETKEVEPAFQPLAVSTAQAAMVERSTGLRLTGTVEGLTSAIISSRYSGQVEEVNVENGQRVYAGQPLFRTDSRELENNLRIAENGVCKARVNFDNIDTNYQRNQKLFEIGAVSQQSMETNVTQREVSLADVADAEENLAIARKRLVDATVTSPVDGVVANKAVNLGQIVSAVQRYERQKEVRISANLDGISLGEFETLFEEAMESIELPAGVSTGSAGEANEMDETMTSIMTAMVLGIAFIFMILAAQFESWTEPFAIMAALPLAFIGALLGLLLCGSNFNMISGIGILLLMGLVTKNAILLIDFAKQCMAKGASCEDALVEAGRVRFRPILMTTLAMMFGMIPIALAIGQGAEARAPMAHAILGGLVTSTLLTLVVIPCLYSLLHSWLGTVAENEKEKNTKASAVLPMP